MNGTILLIGSDTIHRRFLINFLIDVGAPLQSVIFEEEQIEPPFSVKPSFQEEETKFLLDSLSRLHRQDLDRVTVWRVPTANHECAKRILEKINPDLGVLSGARKVNPEVLKHFREGVLNLHLGSAEKYRGLDSNFWAIYHQDFDHLGVTVHWAEAALDTGPIVFQEPLRLPMGVRIHQLRYYETVLGAELLRRSLLPDQAIQIPCRAQVERGRYYSFMPACLKEVAAKHLQQRNERILRQ